MLFEHLWARNLRDAMANANGRLVAGGIVPREVIAELMGEPALSATA